jgi:hypothetical protein
MQTGKRNVHSNVISGRERYENRRTENHTSYIMAEFCMPIVRFQ